MEESLFPEHAPEVTNAGAPCDEQVPLKSEAKLGWSVLDRLETASTFPGLNVIDSRSSTLDIQEQPQNSNCFNAQEWINKRFQSLTSQDFKFKVRVYTTRVLSAPEGLESCWHIFTEEIGDKPLMTEEEAEALEAVLIFSNPFDAAERQLLTNAVVAADLVNQMPPVLWLRHTNEVLQAESLFSQELGMTEKGLSRILESGLNGVVMGEPRVFAMILEIRALISQAMVATNKINDTINEKRMRSYNYEVTKQSFHDWLWHYVFNKVAHSCPPADASLPAGDAAVLGGKEFGRLVGKGSFGSVHALIGGSQEDEGEDEVVRMICKDKFKEVSDIRRIDRLISVMKLVSAAEWRHANIIRFYEVYHSPTHFYLRTEAAGPVTLQQRLLQRLPGPDCQTLSPVATLAILIQINAAATHLHTGPRVCHRDLKPENFRMRESDDGSVLVKLVDFDMATRQAPGSLSQSRCGTLPFTAPEVYFRKHYDGMAADCWSLGIIMAEVQCGTGILDRVLKLPWATAETSSKILETLSSCLYSNQGAKKLFAEYSFLGLLSILPVVEQAASNVLRKDPAERWTSTTVGDVLRAASFRTRRAIR